MLIAKWIFAGIFCLPCFASAQHLVGNGGEGVLDNGNLYVRDLYERDAHLDPYFGSTILEVVRSELERTSFLNLTENQRILLLRKLSDIEGLYPCLGVLMARAFQAYTWSLETTDLGLLPDEEAIRSYSDHLRVPIANRYIQSIRIHRASWMKLSDEQKVVLLIHEMVYGMSVARRIPGNFALYRQSLGITRELVAFFFSHEQSLTADKKKLIAEALGLNLMTGGIACIDETSDLVVLLKTSNENKFFKKVVIPGKASRSVISKSVKELCKSVGSASSAQGVLFEFIGTRSSSSRLEFKSFPMVRKGQGEFFHQLVITNAESEGTYKTCNKFGDLIPRSEDCATFFTAEVEAWKSVKDYVRFPICEE